MAIIDILMFVPMLLELLYDDDYVYILSFVCKFIKIPDRETYRMYVY